MSKELKKYHYEFIEARGPGRQWRVGDYEDDPVASFATEAEAKAFVEEHNRKIDEITRVSKGTFSPEARAAADAFFAHKKEHPEPVPYEQLTPLQKRMQSGDV